MSLSTFSLTQLRAYSSKMEIVVTGNKTMKATHIAAIEAFERATVMLEDAVEDIRPVAEVALVATVLTAEIVVDCVVVAYEFYTSSKAMEVYKAIGVALLTLAIAIGIGAKKAVEYVLLVFCAAWKTPTARRLRRNLKEQLNGWTRTVGTRLEAERAALMFLLMVEQVQVESLEISDAV